MILQFNPPIPVTTPKGKALAQALIDDGPEHDIYWICFQNDTGECWVYPNAQIRAQRNITHGREHISPFYDPDDVAFKYEENDYKSMYEYTVEQLKYAKQTIDESEENFKTICKELDCSQELINKLLKQRNDYQAILRNQPGVD